MTKPLYFYNGTTFELVGPTTPQSPIAYQTSAPTAPATGDIWIDSDGDVDTYNRQLTRYYYVATASQTTITGVDANGLTLAYVAGSEAVYVNGALQVRGQDYTATNGTSIVMSSGLAVNDVVEIFAYTAFTVANAYTKSETDGVAAAAAGLRMVVPSSVAVGSGSGSANAAGYVTFSGASSVSLNDVFSTTYDNYKVVIRLTAASTALNTNFRYRVSNADNSTSNYNKVSYYAGSDGTSGLNNSLAAAQYPLSTFSGTAPTHQTMEMLISLPFATDYTVINNLYLAKASTGTFYSQFESNYFNATTSFTGFTVYASTGNITGTISVYGLKD